jgi:hypothetical protein
MDTYDINNLLNNCDISYNKKKTEILEIINKITSNYDINGKNILKNIIRKILKKTYINVYDVIILNTIIENIDSNKLIGISTIICIIDSIFLKKLLDNDFKKIILKNILKRLPKFNEYINLLTNKDINVSNALEQKYYNELNKEIENKKVQNEAELKRIENEAKKQEAQKESLIKYKESVKKNNSLIKFKQLKETYEKNKYLTNKNFNDFYELIIYKKDNINNQLKTNISILIQNCDGGKWVPETQNNDFSGIIIRFKLNLNIYYGHVCYIDSNNINNILEANVYLNSKIDGLETAAVCISKNIRERGFLDYLFYYYLNNSVIKDTWLQTIDKNEIYFSYGFEYLYTENSNIPFKYKNSNDQEIYIMRYKKNRSIIINNISINKFNKISCVKNKNDNDDKKLYTLINALLITNISKYFKDKVDLLFDNNLINYLIEQLKKNNNKNFKHINLNYKKDNILYYFNTDLLYQYRIIINNEDFLDFKNTIYSSNIFLDDNNLKIIKNFYNLNSYILTFIILNDNPECYTVNKVKNKPYQYLYMSSLDNNIDQDIEHKIISILSCESFENFLKNIYIEFIDKNKTYTNSDVIKNLEWFKTSKYSTFFKEITNNFIEIDSLINNYKTLNIQQQSIIKTSNTPQQLIIKTSNTPQQSIIKTSNTPQQSIIKTSNTPQQSIIKTSNTPQQSIIKVFVYQIKVNDGVAEKYSFKKLKKVNNSTLEIKSKEFKKTSNNNLLYTKNIIEDIKEKTDKNISQNILKNDNEILLLYEEYYTLSARLTSSENFTNNTSKNNLFTRLKTNIYNNIISLLTESKEIMINYIKKNSNIIDKITDYNNIVLRLKEKKTSKIIVMGDQHGSFHSFFRIIIRLKIMNIIDNNYKLDDNYKIIFLGDILDRGLFAVEILYIIFKLIIANNTENELKIILNRGNHEEFDTYYHYGFIDEFFKITSKNKIDTQYSQSLFDISNDFKDLFKYCSSAIILEHNNINYWLCHGGFPIYIDSLSIIKNNPDDKIYVINNYNANLIKKNENINMNKLAEKSIISEIRWNDFISDNENSRSSRDEGAGSIHNIGIKSLNKFKEYLNINFIIRGHTDNESNAMLLSKNGWFYINDINHIKMISKNTNIDKLITYNNLETSKKADNEIAIINPSNFNDKNNDILYPVLTISNNCDNGRDLYNDSYVIIESV